ncbi:MAG TPA: hypothetical protein ENJ19_08365 [Gammaproteobacteria bacterium]|nr:hypothetical protein [Gammaproteobacteria bacterium]
MRRYLDMALLARPLRDALGALFLAVGMVVGGGYYRADKSAALELARTGFEALNGEYRAVLRAQRIFRDEYNAYQALEAGGFIGPEDRLHWVEGLRDSVRKLEVSSAHYHIDENRPTFLAGEQPGGAFQLYVSPMGITLDLLHEGGLFDFLTLLARQDLGVYQVRQCVLTPVDGEGELKARQPNVRARCEFWWYTLRPGGGQGGAAGDDEEWAG